VRFLSPSMFILDLNLGSVCKLETISGVSVNKTPLNFKDSLLRGHLMATSRFFS